LRRYGEALLDPLVETGRRIIIRPHPQSRKSEQAMLDALTARYKGAGNLEWDYEADNLFSLSRAELMISDFSGIIFDYLFLFDKPVLYINHDIDFRPYDTFFLEREHLWHFETLRKTGVELTEKDFADIDGIIEKTLGSAELRDARCAAKEAGWRYQGEAGKRIADFMTEEAP
jgi:CDP-glycerol glycerophosphotransferase (TagB/SpsB family)